MNKRYLDYFCKECNQAILANTALYGSGLCRKCSHSGKRHYNLKRHLWKCADCRKQLKNNRNKYCRSCWRKHNKGKENPNYRHGKVNGNQCRDCGKKIYYSSIYCDCCKGKGRRGFWFGKRAPHGKGAYYKNIWMRSSYEIKYAQYLDKKKLKWYYEPTIFDLGEETYTPDFYLPSRDLWIEVKGYWRPDAKRKFIKFKQLYSELDIVVLDRLRLKKLGLIIK